MSCGRRDPTPADLTTARQQQTKSKEDAYEWFVKTTVGAYERIGKHDPKWDGDAKVALNLIASASANRPDVPGDWQQQVSTFARAALDKGCDDPFIRYAAIRYGIGNFKKTDLAVARELQEAVRQLVGTDYPPRLQYYATQRAMEALIGALPEKPEEQTQSDLFAIDSMLNFGANPYIEAIRDTTTPPEEIYQMCLTALDAPRMPPDGFLQLWQQTDKALSDSGQKSNVRELVKGWYHIQYAWRARGNGYANEVTQEGGKLFEERLKIAEKALTAAWEQDNADTRPATLMIGVCLGLGKERPEMERRFHRAMLAAPDNYEACFDKLHYLKPIWLGSPEDMLAFGHECLTNTSWKGRTALLIVDAHDYLSTYGRQDPAARQAYWLRPEVWSDIHAAYEEFFRREPDALNWRQSYVRDAYRCHAWDTLNEQLELTGPVNYDYFGGREAFDRMVAVAKSHRKP